MVICHCSLPFAKTILTLFRISSASLGCQVDVVRMVVVGDCSWLETGVTKKSRLLVAEAYVRPDHHLMKQDREGNGGTTSPPIQNTSLPQLRVSLTGATTSGKSSLLGTLSTGTLDNGRGKSRLSLLKHRHEIESGITSSITQELVGYGDLLHPEGIKPQSQVINYGCTDISSWTDIHASAESLAAGRLVFLTDSAGHPRFRRTTVRGLVGWDPHYTLLCVPSDNIDDSSTKQGPQSSSRENLVSATTEMDLSGELLRLCLSLDLPLVIIVTKYDLAKKAALKGTLTRVLSALKEAGRTGRIIADPSSSNTSLDTICSTDLLEAEATAKAFDISLLATVPIVLTSSLNGTGLRKLHALLRTLPVPTDPDTSAVRGPLFHIEDIYAPCSGITASEKPIVVGGHLRFGELSIDDELVLGPYPVDTSSDDSDSGSGRRSIRNSPVTTSRSYPGALHKRSTAPMHTRGPLFEWRAVRVTSLRNLRLPVPTLYSGQVGTVGLVPVGGPTSGPTILRIRKGMVLSDKHSQAHKIIAVEFEGPQAESAKALAVGSAVVIFFASVRAPSKVISVTRTTTMKKSQEPMVHGDGGNEFDEEGFGFGFGFDEDSAVQGADEDGGGGTTAMTTTVQFQFIGSREFVEQGVKVLVMPGGGPGLSGSIERGEKGVAGLEGFVGKVASGNA